MSPARATWPLPAVYDFSETTRLLRTGSGDPTVRRFEDGLWRTMRTADGPATVRLEVEGELRAEAWGPGAERALGDVPAWVGLEEPAWELPPHPVTDRLLREHPGLRGNDTRDLFEALVVVTLQQLVTWEEAAANWRRMCAELGEEAPGPEGLRLAPEPRTLRRVGPERLRELGVRLPQARTIVELAKVAHALPAVAALSTAEALAKLRTIPGVGPWTAALALGLRCARPEPVPVGDVHLPNTVAWVLAGEERADDARMLELLRPFEGHAFRVLRLIGAARLEAPRRGPKRPWRKGVGGGRGRPRRGGGPRGR